MIKKQTKRETATKKMLLESKEKRNYNKLEEKETKRKKYKKRFKNKSRTSK